MNIDVALIRLWPFIDKGISIVLLLLLIFLIRYSATKFKEISSCMREMKKSIQELDKGAAVTQEKLHSQEKEISHHERDINKLNIRVDKVGC